ncbi:MAG TPA: hypothetical protein VKZ84_07400 [Bacteriovoracaceae bacterium]|nr:hypothetical protein [Bacteriovoracaceae bacterium]
MIKFTLFTLMFFTLSVWGKTCRGIDQEITATQHEINMITIPEIAYTPDEYNCSLVSPTLQATYEIETHLTQLLKLYQTYYFECGRHTDVIYMIEDTKINIILMQTLTSLTKNLDEKCLSN